MAAEGDVTSSWFRQVAETLASEIIAAYAAPSRSAAGGSRLASCDAMTAVRMELLGEGAGIRSIGRARCSCSERCLCLGVKAPSNTE